MVGGGALMAEIGAGMNYLYVYKNYNKTTGLQEDDNVSYFALTGHLGLRYQKLHSVFFRGGFSPVFPFSGQERIPIIADKKMIGMFSLGIGYTL